MFVVFNMRYLLIILSVFSFSYSQPSLASSRLIPEFGGMAFRQVVRSLSTSPSVPFSWDVVPVVKERGIVRPVIDWTAGKAELPITFEENVGFIERFHNECVPKMAPQTNHRVDFRSSLKLESSSAPFLSDSYKKAVEDASARVLRNYEPENIKLVDTILREDLVLFTAYPSYEIRNGGIKDCRWFVDYADIKKIKTLDDYLENLAILKRWVPLSELYDSLALMHLRKGSRFCALVGKAALQTHPGFRDFDILLSLPYPEQFVACQEMVGHLISSVEGSFGKLHPERQGLFRVKRVLEDLQIQILGGGGKQIHVFYADNAQMFNLGIVDEPSAPLNVDDIIANIARGVLH